MTTADRLAWRTSSWSSDGENCMEVAPASDGVVIRHSKHHTAGTIAFTFPAWAAFVRETRDGLPSANQVIDVAKIGTDTFVLYDRYIPTSSCASTRPSGPPLSPGRLTASLTSLAN